jgi:curved DNA-binding protein CbpA
MDTKATKVREQAKAVREAYYTLQDGRRRGEGIVLTEEQAVAVLAQVRAADEALHAAANKLEYVAGAALHALGEAMG